MKILSTSLTAEIPTGFFLIRHTNRTSAICIKINPSTAFEPSGMMVYCYGLLYCPSAIQSICRHLTCNFFEPWMKHFLNAISLSVSYEVFLSVLLYVTRLRSDFSVADFTPSFENIMFSNFETEWLLILSTYVITVSKLKGFLERIRS